MYGRSQFLEWNEMLITWKLTHGLLIVKERTTDKIQGIIRTNLPPNFGGTSIPPIVLCDFLKFSLVRSEKYSDDCRKTFYSDLLFCDIFSAFPAGIIDECPPPSIAH